MRSWDKLGTLLQRFLAMYTLQMKNNNLYVPQTLLHEELRKASFSTFCPIIEQNRHDSSPTYVRHDSSLTYICTAQFSSELRSAWLIFYLYRMTHLQPLYSMTHLWPMYSMTHLWPTALTSRCPISLWGLYHQLYQEKLFVSLSFQTDLFIISFMCMRVKGPQTGACCNCAPFSSTHCWRKIAVSIYNLVHFTVDIVLLITWLNCISVCPQAMPNSSLNSIAYDVTSHLWGVHSSNTRSEYFVNYRTIKHLMCARRSFCVVSWNTVKEWEWWLYEPSTYMVIFWNNDFSKLDGSRIVTSESPSPMQGKL